MIDPNGNSSPSARGRRAASWFHPVFTEHHPVSGLIPRDNGRIPCSHTGRLRSGSHSEGVFTRSATKHALSHDALSLWSVSGYSSSSALYVTSAAMVTRSTLGVKYRNGVDRAFQPTDSGMEVRDEREWISFQPICSAPSCALLRSDGNLRLTLRWFADHARYRIGRSAFGTRPDDVLMRQTMGSSHALHNAGLWPAFPGRDALSI